MVHLWKKRAYFIMLPWLLVPLLGALLLHAARLDVAQSAAERASEWSIPERRGLQRSTMMGVSSMTLTLQTVASGLVRPVAITHAGDERLFIVEKPGRIRIVQDGVLLDAPFLDITDKVDDSGNEQGLLGLAFHPQYAQNGYFFVNYTYDPGPDPDRTRIARYQVRDTDPNLAQPLEMVVMEVEQDFSNHNGGSILFGPEDGYLYIGMGDGGSSGDPYNRAQDNSQLLGKILRIDVDGTNGAECDISQVNHYAIPMDNPLVGGGGGQCDEIWARGVRNPWRITFDRLTGDLWIADVGQNLYEEINFQPGSSQGGENWGWRCYEGDTVYNSSDCQLQDAYDFPVHVYTHDGNPYRCSVTGGYVYRGDSLRALWGHYLFADYCSRQIWSLAGSEFTPFFFDVPITDGAPLGNVNSFGEGVAGELYLAEDGTSARIFKVVAANLPCAAQLPISPETAIRDDAGYARLDWADASANSGGYRIYRSTVPYFTPEGASLLATLPAGSKSYVDSTHLIGDPAVNHSYMVQSLNCDGSLTANGGEVGEFDFAIATGGRAALRSHSEAR